MHANHEHLQLTEKLFRDVIDHLTQRIQVLEGRAGDPYDSDETDLVGDEQTPEAQSTVTALRLEICLYSLCVDWVRQQREALEGVPDEERRHTRENFFRLMATVAQSELARDAHVRSFGLAGELLRKAPLTDAQMFTALEGTAERQLANLISL